MSKLDAVCSILLEEYNLEITPIIAITNNNIIMSLLEKNKDKEFELLLHMVREYYLEDNFFIYAIQSKYFAQILNVFSQLDIKSCAKTIIDNSVNGKSIFYNSEIEYALRNMIPHIKFGESATSNLKYILMFAIQHYLPNTIKFIMSTIYDYPNDIKHYLYRGVYSAILDRVNLKTITYVQFTHMYQMLLPMYGVVIFIGRPLDIISDNIYHSIMKEIAYPPLIYKNEDQLLHIFAFLLENDKNLKINVNYLVRSMCISNFMNSYQKTIFDMTIDCIIDRIQKQTFDFYLFKGIEDYVIYCICSILDNSIRNEYVSEYVYIVTKILTICPLYTNEQIWNGIVALGGDIIERLYSITRQHHPDFVLPKKIYASVLHTEIHWLIELDIIRLDGAFDDYLVCQYICESNVSNIMSLIEFNSLGFPLSMECYQKLEMPNDCPHKKFGTKCTCSPMYKSIPMYQYLDKFVVRDVNWQSVKSFIKLTTALKKFFIDNPKVQTKIESRVFSINRFANHISSFYGWQKKPK